MSEIKVISKETHKVLETVNGDSISVSEASVVLIKVNSQDVDHIAKEGHNAVIHLKNGETIIIENFFPNGQYQTENSLVFEDDQHKLLWAQFTDAQGAVLENVQLGYIDSIEPLLYHEASSPWAWLAIPVVAGGIIAWAGGSHGDKSKGDTEAPNAPIINPVNGKDPITGTAEPGSTIIVTFPNGKTETTVTNPDGTWTVPNPGLKDGDKVTATATDPSNNTSPPATAIVDAVAPDAPVIDPVNGKDPITGTAEPGSSIIVTFPNGKTETTVTNPDGTWTVPNPGLKDGDKITATATDSAHNTSPPATAIVDAVAPDAPVIDPVNGKDPITGTAEPGSSIIVTFPNGKTETTVTNPDGTWTVPNPGLKDGDKITATATDSAHNTSPPATAIVDAAAPDAPIINPPSETDPITGTAEPNSKIIVTFPDGSTETTVTNPDGTWTVPNPGLKDGDEIKATATDAVGNTSPETIAVVDVSVPSTLVEIESYSDNVAPQVGDFASGTSTNDATPTLNLVLTGTLAAGDVVNIYRDGVKVGTATLGTDHKYHFTDSTLVDGLYEYTARVENSSGKVGPISAAFEILVDTQAPAQLQIDEVIDDVEYIVGQIAAGGSTNDTHPTVKGHGAEPNATVTLKDSDGTILGTTVAAADGTWSIEPTSALTEGPHHLQVTQTDKAGNESAPESFDLVVDTLAPSQSINITDVVDAVNPVTGSIANHGYTDDTAPTLKGTLSQALGNGEKVVVLRDGQVVGEATVTGNTWSFKDSSLENGKQYEYNARVEDAAGNRGGISNNYVINIDTVAPTQTVQIVSATDNVGPITGELTSGATTDDSTPSLNGTISSVLAANEVIVIYRDGIKVGTATIASGSTTWSYTDHGLVNGHDYSYTAQVEDASGLTGPISNTFDLSYVTDGSSNIATITEIEDDVAPVVGVVANDGYSNDTAPLVKGSLLEALAAGEKVIVYRDGQVIGEAIVTGQTWSFQDSNLQHGEQYTYSVVVESAAGIAGAESNSYTIHIDTVAPNQSVIITEVFDNKEPVTGVVTNGGFTNDDTPEIKGTLSSGLTAGEVLVVYRDGVKVGTATVTGNAWSFSDSSLASGQSYTYTAQVEDLAGNTSALSNSYNINTNFDGASQSVAIVRVLDDVDPVQGVVSNKGYTNDKTPTLEGSIGSALSSGDVVVIYRDGIEVGTATVTGTTWQFTDNLNSDGHYSYSAAVRNNTGDTGAPSAVYEINLDTQAPAQLQIDEVIDNVEYIVGQIAAGGSTNDTHPTVKGHGAEPNATVTLKDSDGTILGTTVAAADGTWSIEPTSALTEGPHHLQVTQTDKAGNESAPESFDLIVDTLAPSQSINITDVVDAVNPVTGSIANHGYTDDTAPTLKGTLSQALGNGEKVVVLRDGQVVGEATVTGNTWSFKDSSLENGKQYEYSARVEDAAGNRGGISNNYVINIDTVAPTQTVQIVSATDNVGPITGELASGATTDDSTPSLNGTISSILAANEVIVIYRDGIKVGTATIASGSTTWSYTDHGLVNGHDYSYTAQVEDASGLTGPISNTFDLSYVTDGSSNIATITEIEDDVAPVVGVVANDGYSNDTAPLVKGSLLEALAAGEKVIVYRDGQVIGEAIVTGQTWSFQDSNLQHGEQYTYSVVVESAAGIAGAESNSYTIHIDTVAPNQSVVITEVFDNKEPVTGVVTNGGFTNDDTPEIKGTLSSGLTAGEVLVVYRDGVKVGTATVTGNAWSFSDSSLASGQSYTYTAQVEDLAGNTSALSNSYNINTNFDGASQSVAIVRVLDDVDPVQGVVSNKGYTNDKTPTLEGSIGSALSSGDVVVIYRDGIEVGTATVTGTTWQFTDNLNSDGHYSYSAAVRNNTGDTGAPSAVYEINLDTQAPAQLQIDEVIDDVEYIVGQIAAGGSTNDTHPTVKGHGAEPNATVTLKDSDGTILGTTVAAADGTWSIEPTSALTEGPHHLQVTQTDKAGNESAPESFDLIVDTLAPSLDISISDLELSAGEVITVTFKFSEAVTGFDIGDVVVTGGILSALTTTDNITWTANFTQSGSSQPSIKVNDGSYTDVAGNAGTGDIIDASNGFNTDLTAPTLAISASDLELTAGEVITVTFKFSEAVTGFDSSDITAVGGNLTGLTQVDASTWTATFTQSGTAQPSISVADGSYTDLAGNLGTGDVLDASNGFNTDLTAPTLAISASDLELSAGEVITVTFKFSEAVTGFDSSDITAVGGNLTGLTQVDASTWTATFTQSGTAQPSISVADGSYTDLAGNLGTGDVLDASNGFNTDLIAPTLAISASDLELSAGEVITVTFKFSEAVTGFDSSDITAVGGNLTGLTQVDASTWTATFTQSGTAQPSISVADGSYTDLAGNLGTGDVLDASNGFNTDLTAPTLAISASDLELSAGEVITVTFKFSEAVTGFDSSDITAVGGNLTGLTQVDASTWTATFTQSGTAQPSISVADGSYTDLAGNLGTGDVLDASNGFNTDLIAPTLAISASDLELSAGEVITVTFKFSEAVTGFDSSDITAVGGNLTGLTQVDASTWTATFTQSGTAQPSISVADGSYTDLAGNLGTGDVLDASNGFNTDLIAPTLAISASDLELSAGEVITVTFKFSEAVTGFDSSDITAVGGNLTGLTQVDASTWTATFTQSGTAQPSISVADGSYTDLAGNLGTGDVLDASNGFNTDLIAPTLAISASDLELSAGEVITVTFKFSEAVTGFDSSDITAVGGNLTGLTQVDASTWTATFTQSGTAQPSISVADGSYTDLAGNLGTGDVLDASNGFNTDLTAPTLAISASDLELSAGEVITVTFKFSEAVTGFDSSDITAVGGNLTGLTQVDASTWTATFTQSGTAQPSISVADGSYTDLAGNLGTGDVLDASNGFNTDLTAPTLAISASDLELSAGEVITVTFKFSEAVTGFDSSDITAVGGNLTGLTQVDASTWTATFTQSGTAQPSISVADGSYTDLAGNLGTGDVLDASNGFNTDLTAPTLAISASDLELSAGEVITVTFKFSEAVTGFDSSDITAVGGNLTGLTQVDASTWTATFTQSGTAQPSISVADGSYTDLAGNLGTGDVLDASNGFNTDLIAPTLAISASDLELSAGEVITVTFKFSEAVTGFDSSDITAVGGNLTGLTQVDASTWTATFTQSGTAQPSISVADGSYTDLAGNLGTGDIIDASNGFNTDLTAPTLAISASDLELTAGEVITVTFKFSEAVTGFDSSDITAVGGNLTGLTQVDASTWTATFTQSGTAQPSISVADGSYTDLAGNLGTGDVLDASNGFNTDLTAPTLAISASDLELSAGEVITVTFKFSEAVTGFDSSDITAVGGNLTGLTQVDASTWTATFTQSGTAQPSISVADGSYTDLAGNLGTGDVLDASNGFNTDLIAPTLAISASDLELSAGEVITVTFKFSEAVTGFDSSDITAVGGNLTGLTQVDASTWTATFTQSGTAQPSISVADGSYTDLAGNLGTGDVLDASNGFNTDLTAPTLAISASDLELSAGEVITVTFKFSEAVTGFDSSDITAVGGNLTGLTQVDASTWTATFTQSGTAQPSISVADGSYTDLAGNLGTGDVLDASNGFNTDLIAPTLAISASDLELSAGEVITVTFKFSEAVTGFDSSDITAVGGNLTGLTQVDASTWTATFTQSGTAQPSISVADGSYTDLAGNLGTGDVLDASNGFNTDLTAPTLAISASDLELSAGEVITVTFKFSEAVTGFDSSDITAVGGNLTGLTQVDASTWTATFTQSGTAQPSISVADGSYTDLAGNLGTGDVLDASNGFNTDLTAPTLAISASDLELSAGEVITVTFKFSEAVTGFDSSDITAVGGNLTGLTQVDASTWTATFTQSGTAQPSISVADGSYTDLAGNLGTGDVLDASNGFNTDLTAPTLAISASDLELSAGEVITVTFKFSEAVTGFDSSDITAVGGNLTGLTQVDASTWTATFTQGGTAQPSISVADGSYTDLAGNLGTGDVLDASNGFNTDLTAPTLAISASDLELSAGEVITVTFKFSEAVTGFDSSDITAVGGNLTGLTQVDASTWTATFTQSGTAQPSISVADGSYTDLAGNLGTGDVLDASNGFNTDLTAPTLAISASDLELSAGEVITVTFKFSEAVTGFDSSDITAVGGNVTGLTQVDASTWTATFTQGGTAQPSISVADGSYTDLAGNLGTGDVLDASNGFNTDLIAPTLAISASDLELSAGEVITVTFKFSEAVTGFDSSDITAVGGNLTGLTQVDASTWTATFTQSGTAQPSISVADGSYTDLAGNLGTGDVLDASNGFNTDITPLTLNITDDVAAAIATGPVKFTFSFNKDVSDFDLNDIVVTGGTAATTLTQVSAQIYTLIVTPTVNSTGTISVNVAANAATDSAGNKNAAASGSQNYDTVIPLETVTITSFTDDVGSITGDFGSNSKTDDTAPVLNGTINTALDAGHQVAVYASDNTLLGYATVDTTSLTWSYALTGLTEGSSSYYAKVVSAVGNEGTKSNDFTIIVDLTPPVVTNLTTDFSLDVDTANGVPASGITTTITQLNNDLITRDNTPTAVKGSLSSTLAAGEMLQISKDNGVTWQDVSSLSGKDWVYNLSDTYTSDTTLNFKLRVRDEAGNSTALSTEDRTVVIDITAPNAPTLAPVVPTQTNNVVSNVFSNTLYGKLEAGTTIALINDVNKNGMWQEGIDTVIASAVVAADGTWSFNTELPSGALNLAFVVWDKAGNISRLSPIAHTGVASNNSGTETIIADWGGTATASGTGLGMNSAAVGISQNGNWNFFQAVTAANGTNAYAGRVYEVMGGTHNSKYLTEPAGLGAHGYGGVITSTVFADFNRDGYNDVISQVSDFNNAGRIPYWTGSSSGNYTGQTISQGTANHLGAVVAYDRTGDGYLDLVIGDSATDSLVFMRNNNGSFVPETGNGSNSVYNRPPSSAFTVSNGLGTGTAIGAALPVAISIFKTLSGVDLDNNGAVDILANVSYNGAVSVGDNSRGLGVLYNSGGSAGFTYINNANVFMTGGGANDEGRLLMSMTYADFNGDGWLDLYINRGSKAGADSNESRIYLNDGKGQLKATDAEALWFGDNRAGGSSFAVDWNLDGKMDVIEVPVATVGTAFAPTLYMNMGTGVWGAAGSVTALSSVIYNNITGATAVDYDWDGSVDLVLYRSGVNTAVGAGDNASSTIVIRNTNIAADGTSLHVRIVDGLGFNSYYGNTVKLYDSTGKMISTQVINPQSSGSSDSTGIVNFYGLDPNETYSVQLLRNINGTIDNVSGVASLGGYANSTINQSWTGIKAGQANEAIILTAESDGAITDSKNNPTGITGTGYNDHFYASLGNDLYNGGGGWEVDATGNKKWVANGGMDILDYSKLNVGITVDIAAGTVTKTIGSVITVDSFVNIERFIAGKGDAVFNGSSGNDHFSGGAGNDTYNLGAGGQDTIYFILHNAADATGGNGSDTINGFHVGQVATDLNADIIDINELLSSYTGTAGLYTDSDGVKLDYASTTLLDYLKITNDGTNTTIEIDRDGGGDHFTTLVTLNGVQTDLVELLYNNQLII